MVGLLVGALAACRGIEVKSVLADRPRHLQLHFSADHIPPAALTVLPPERTDRKPFQHFVVTYVAELAHEHLDVTCTSVYLKRGAIRTDCESTNNGFAVGSYIEISYLGLIRLRSEVINYRNSMAAPIIELREVAQFPANLITATPEASYRFQATLGTESHEGRLVDLDYAIRTTHAQPAAQLEPSLSGQALEVQIETNNVNGLLGGRDTRLYLADYGVAIRRSVQSADGVDKYTVTHISVD